jgi:hypothetical protein
MRHDINRRLKKLEEVHSGHQPTEPEDDDAVRIWKLLLIKRRMAEEAGRPSQSPPPTLEWVREYVARKRAERDDPEG